MKMTWFAVVLAIGIGFSFSNTAWADMGGGAGGGSVIVTDWANEGGGVALAPIAQNALVFPPAVDPGDNVAIAAYDPATGEFWIQVTGP